MDPTKLWSALVVGLDAVENLLDADERGYGESRVTRHETQPDGTVVVTLDVDGVPYTITVERTRHAKLQPLSPEQQKDADAWDAHVESVLWPDAQPTPPFAEQFPTVEAYTRAIEGELTPVNFMELDPAQMGPDDVYVPDLPADAALIAALYARMVAPRVAAGCIILDDVNSAYVRSRWSSFDALVDALVEDEIRNHS